jgi:hypothetical protein
LSSGANAVIVLKGKIFVLDARVKPQKRITSVIESDTDDFAIMYFLMYYH